MEIKPIKIKEYYEIPVEDSESIKINLNDNSFLNNLDELRKYATEKQVELNRERKGGKSLEEEIKKINEYSEVMSKIIEKTFGEGTLEKVFGTRTPTIEALSEFIEHLTPYIEEIVKKKKKKIEKMDKEYKGRAEKRAKTR